MLGYGYRGRPEAALDYATDDSGRRRARPSSRAGGSSAPRLLRCGAAPGVAWACDSSLGRASETLAVGMPAGLEPYFTFSLVSEDAGRSSHVWLRGSELALPAQPQEWTVGEPGRVLAASWQAPDGDRPLATWELDASAGLGDVVQVKRQWLVEGGRTVVWNALAAPRARGSVVYPALPPELSGFEHAPVGTLNSPTRVEVWHRDGSEAGFVEALKGPGWPFTESRLDID